MVKERYKMRLCLLNVMFHYQKEFILAFMSKDVKKDFTIEDKKKDLE